MKTLLREYKGILFATLLGTTVYLAAPFIPSVNSILAGFILGIIIGNLFTIPESFQSGIAFTGSKLLELSILFLAFSINFTHIAALGWRSFSMLIIVIALASVIIIFLVRKMKFKDSTGWLIGFGTLICGSSAIAALAPTVSKSKNETGISIAVVNLLGSIGMVAIPFVLARLHLTNEQCGILLGGTLQSVGNVAGAGYAMGNEIGEASITIKLARVALLSPALIFFNYMINKNNVKHWKEHFKLPWYLWSFIGITIITSFIKLPEAFISQMETFGKIVLTIALCAIGLRVSFKALYQSGKKGLLFGTIVFAIQILLVALFML